MAGRSITAKWPGGLLDAGFVPVARVFLRNYFRLEPRLSDFEAIFLMNLVDYVWEGDCAYPAPSKVAEDLGIPVNRVESTLVALVASGYLHKTQVRDRIGYRFEGLYRKLNELIAKGEAWNRRSPQGGSEPEAT